MSDVIIFGVGCFVTIIVMSAVGLLLWGAGNEPRGELLPTGDAPSGGGERAPDTSEPTPAPSA